jgi:hypothetical protein
MQLPCHVSSLYEPDLPEEIAEGWMIVYMDNILIFLKTLEENQERTCRVLEIIYKETLFLKPEKCTFDAQEVD